MRTDGKRSPRLVLNIVSELLIKKNPFLRHRPGRRRKTTASRPSRQKRPFFIKANAMRRREPFPKIYGQRKTWRQKRTVRRSCAEPSFFPDRIDFLCGGRAFTFCRAVRCA
ncbi:hypothetical protein HMPREF7215_2613 [Pyramidobacter piscolens W5455]|uniref:Uncharacterized protein n=1 Tax=Pyramidobacter piscolens W5455 TaxID=352165 RepID=A0ABP2HQX3_9BACT|nr:hypothetical protein HMPREF7215_2613 [Pyramidobacter piscolens W5455]